MEQKKTKLLFTIGLALDRCFDHWRVELVNRISPIREQTISGCTKKASLDRKNHYHRLSLRSTCAFGRRSPALSHKLDQ